MVSWPPRSRTGIRPAGSRRDTSRTDSALRRSASRSSSRLSRRQRSRRATCSLPHWATAKVTSPRRRRCGSRPAPPVAEQRMLVEHRAAALDGGTGRQDRHRGTDQHHQRQLAEGAGDPAHPTAATASCSPGRADHGLRTGRGQLGEPAPGRMNSSGDLDPFRSARTCRSVPVPPDEAGPRRALTAATGSRCPAPRVGPHPPTGSRARSSGPRSFMVEQGPVSPANHVRAVPRSRSRRPRGAGTTVRDRRGGWPELPAPRRADLRVRPGASPADARGRAGGQERPASARHDQPYGRIRGGAGTPHSRWSACR